MYLQQLHAAIILAPDGSTGAEIIARNSCTWNHGISKRWSVVSVPPCDGFQVIVDYGTPEDEYTTSMIADAMYPSCGPWYDLKKMLFGSGRMWRSSCKKIVPHILIIEPLRECYGGYGDAWMVQYVAFKLKNVQKVEVYIDDEPVFSVSCRRRVSTVTTLSMSL